MTGEIKYEDVQSIGDKYLQRHPESKTFFFGFFKLHTNQVQAEKLKNCTSTNEQDCMELLAEVYGELPTHDGEMATTIRDLLENRLECRFKYMLHASNAGAIMATMKSVSDKMRSKINDFCAANENSSESKNRTQSI